MHSDFHKLVTWFCQVQRDLPWRRLRTPYAVWVSEVMLQQTRVAVVIPYFHRWMERFPTVHQLAEASVDEVVKMWEGLGYYSRARNLHLGARQAVERWEGSLPREEELLLAIRGMGRYTAAAVRAFAFGERTVAVDGNVARVGARYLGISEDISKERVKREIGQKLEEFLPERSPQLATEGLIELGATLCLPRSTHCSNCPLQEGCVARKEGRQEALPHKGERPKTLLLRRLVVVVSSQGALLVQRGEAGRVMADLYHFPYFDWPEGDPKEEEVVREVKRVYGLESLSALPMTRLQHTFTRYRATLLPWRLEIASPTVVEGTEWRSHGECLQLPFVSGHRKLLHQVVG